MLFRTHMSLNDKKRLAREKAEQYNSNGRPLRQYHMLTAEEVKQGKETHWEELEIIGILKLCFYKIHFNTSALNS